MIFMYCRECGKELGSHDLFCGKCGAARVQNQQSVAQTVNTDSNNTTDKVLYGVVGFFAPLIGLILSLATRKDKPEAAKIGIIVSVIRLVLNLIYFVFYFLFSIYSYI